MDKFNFAIIAGVIVALLQIIGIVFSICVFKAAYYDYKWFICVESMYQSALLFYNIRNVYNLA